MTQHLLLNENQELEADEAFEQHQKIVSLRARAQTTFLELGKELYEFNQEKRWKKLGFDSFNHYLSDPDVDISHPVASKLMTVYERWILGAGFSPGKILPAGYRKAYMVAPYLDRRSPGELLSVASSLSKRDLKRWIDAEFSEDTPELPDGKYQVIYADPPWPVGSIVLGKWESPIDDKYPTMELIDIARLPIADLAHEACSLFLWTTHTFLPAAITMMTEDWGFKYSCCITWDKGSGWTQNGFHKQTEFLLFGYTGAMNVDKEGRAIPTLISAAKGRHSEKPGEIRDLIAAKTPGPRVELFARGSYPGWEAWGNEA